MPRIFRPNAYFEEEIQADQLSPDWLVSRNSPIESPFLVLSALKEELGRILIHTLPEKRWFAFWRERGLPLENKFLHFKSLKQTIPKRENVEIDEWGRIARWEPGIGLVIDPDLLAKSKSLSSKIRQNEWRKELGSPEFPSHKISALEDWNLLAKQESELFRSYEKFILKPEFGFAGTSRLCFAKDLHLVVPDHLGRWKEGFILEPWASRTKDFSILFSSKKGTLRTEGGTVLLSDPKGKYSGTWIGKSNEIENYLLVMEKIMAPVSIFSEDYSGPGSIDSFFFERNGMEILRKVSEINFRWTMGRLLWELRNGLPKSETSDLLLFFPEVGVPDAYDRIGRWEKESGWDIYPLSSFYSAQGRPMRKNLLWLRLPEKPRPDPWNDSKSAFEQGLLHLNA